MSIIKEMFKHDEEPETSLKDECLKEIDESDCDDDIKNYYRQLVEDYPWGH